jgi:hypothetical protein
VTLDSFEERCKLLRTLAAATGIWPRGTNKEKAMQFAFCLVICLGFGASPSCYSERPTSSDAPLTTGQSILDRLNMLKQIGDGIGAIADGFDKFWNSLKKAVIDVDAGWNELAARRVHAKLVDLSKQLTILPAMQTRAVEDIDDYVRNPTPEGWVQIRLKLSNIFDKVKELVETLKNDNSDFVIGPLYKTLYDTLNQRVRLLESLKVMPPPEKKEELDQLRSINERYKRLVEEMSNARTALGEYLEKQKTRSSSKAQ